MFRFLTTLGRPAKQWRKYTRTQTYRHYETVSFDRCPTFFNLRKAKYFTILAGIKKNVLNIHNRETLCEKITQIEFLGDFVSEIQRIVIYITGKCRN